MLKPFFASVALAAAALLFAPSTVTAQQTPLPSATPSAAPSISPSPTPTPLPSATPLPTPLALPPDAPPQILAVEVSDPVFHSGETVSGTVITSTNVAAVEVRLAGHSIQLSRTDYGVFQMELHHPARAVFSAQDLHGASRRKHARGRDRRARPHDLISVTTYVSAPAAGSADSGTAPDCTASA